MKELTFKIYVAGSSPRNSELAIVFEQACLQQHLLEQCKIQVIDILKNPAEAELKKIMALPTIIREAPLPEKRIIGDFREGARATTALTFLTEDLVSWQNP